MPKMISQNDMVITTTKGHTIQFKAGEEAGVPGEIVEDCMFRGARLVDGEDLPQKEVVEKAAEDEETSREAIITAAMEEVLVKNDRENFAASGAPKIPVLKDMTGFDMSAKERDALWDKAIAVQKLQK